MSDLANLIADMVRAGVDPDIIGRTAEVFASATADAPKQRTAAAIRQERYRHNKASRVTVCDAPSPSEVSPHTPLPNNPNPNPPLPPKGGFPPAEFEAVWEIYPNKVGKRKAEAAYAAARKRDSFENIMAGLRKYVAKTDDRPWCNPATFFNQDRWLDVPQQAHSPPKPKTIGQMFLDDLERLKEAEHGKPDHDTTRQNETSERCGQGDGAGIPVGFAITGNELGRF